MFADVVIPTHNGSATIARAVQSVPVDELALTVSDDGSSDGSAAIATAAAGGRLQVVRNVRQGRSAARNAGAAAGKQDFIVFLDDDDWLTNDFVGHIADHIENSSEVGLVRLAVKYTDGEIVVPTEDLMEKPFAPGSFMISRAVFESIGGYDSRFHFGENTELFFRASAEIMRRRLRVISLSEVGVVCKHRSDAGNYYRTSRIESTKLFLTKHSEDLENYRAFRAVMEGILAHDLKTTGEYRTAFHFACRSVQSAPRFSSMVRLLRIVLCAFRAMCFPRKTSHSTRKTSPLK